MSLLFQIVAGLTFSAIQRLKYTWSLVTSEVQSRTFYTHTWHNEHSQTYLAQ